MLNLRCLVHRLISLRDRISNALSWLTRKYAVLAAIGSRIFGADACVKSALFCDELGKLLNLRSTHKFSYRRRGSW